MAEKACHGFGSTTQVGLTQALGISHTTGELMKKGIFIFSTILLIAACGQQPTNSNGDAEIMQPQAIVQCAKDTDCKGDRVCEGGKCASPSAAAQSLVANGDASAASPSQEPTSLPSNAQWTEGFGQGNLEYFIDHQGLRLHIGCPTQDGSADSSSSVSLYRLSDDTEVPAFIVSVNGHSFDAPFSADSRVGENNFVALLENLHQGDATVIFEGKTVVFPKSNAVQVVPTFGSDSFSCNLM